MGVPADSVKAVCNFEIRGRPCRHAWVVCLSDRLYGDNHHGKRSGKDYRVNKWESTSDTFSEIYLHRYENLSHRVC